MDRWTDKLIPIQNVRRGGSNNLPLNRIEHGSPSEHSDCHLTKMDMASLNSPTKRQVLIS